MPHTFIARDFMNRDFPLLRPSQTIAEAVKVLLRHRKRGTVVVDDEGNLLGVLSEKDCLKAFASAIYHKEYSGTVGEYMSREVLTVTPETGIMEIVALFLRHPYYRFPVLDQGKLVGTISRRALLAGLDRAQVWDDANKTTHQPMVGRWFGRLQGGEGRVIQTRD